MAAGPGGAGDGRNMNADQMEFMWNLDEDRVVEAIREAESRTSAEIRVFVSNKEAEHPVTAARGHFVRMGMEKTQRRNGVLIFFAPASRTFAVIGDEAAHAVCGDRLWHALVREMRKLLLDESSTAAIVHAIKRIADALAPRFPHEADDRNELPDAVERGD